MDWTEIPEDEHNIDYWKVLHDSSRDFVMNSLKIIMI